MDGIDSMTNQELIDELLRRHTFRGLIAYQVAPSNNQCESSEDWHWEARRCDFKECLRQLIDSA